MEIIDLIQSSPLWTSAIGDEVASTGRSLADAYKGSTTPSGRVQHLQRYQSLVERNADALTYAEHLVFGIGFDGEGGSNMVLMDEIQEFRWILALHNSIVCLCDAVCGGLSCNFVACATLHPGIPNEYTRETSCDSSRNTSISLRA